ARVGCRDGEADRLPDVLLAEGQTGRRRSVDRRAVRPGGVAAVPLVGVRDRRCARPGAASRGEPAAGLGDARDRRLGRDHGTPAEIRSKSSERLKREWDADDRWAGIERGYGAEEVIRLRGSVEVEHSLARRGAEKLWRVLHTVLVPTGHFVRTLQAARLAADV